MRRMHKLSLVLVVSLFGLACGPREPSVPQPREMTARIKNEYAVSLFTLTVRVGEADAGVLLFDDERIEAGRSATATFQATTGDVVTFDLSAVSLGDRKSFPTATMDPVEDSKSTLQIEYDYDLATANFVARRGWAR